MAQYGAPTERRDSERLAVCLDALVHPYRETPFLCMMHDICVGGALLTLYGQSSLRPGDEILVQCADMEMVSTVAWITDDACGVRFHRRLYASEVTALRMIETDQSIHPAFLPPAFAGARVSERHIASER